MDKKIIIGTRGSDLALWQANFIKSELTKIGLEPVLQIIKTQGDQIQNLSFEKMEGKGFFTKELEEALLSGAIDLAVHSFKDLPTTSPDGLIIAALSKREDPSELLLINKDAVDLTKKFNLKTQGIVGTSSPRRKSQLLAFRNDVTIKDLRGNVPTRVQKLRERQYDAILLAKAGVDRLQLDLSDFHVEVIEPVEFIPAPAQGVLAIQIREDNKELFEVLQNGIHNREVENTVGLERKILNLFDGGCQLPLGAYCIKENGNYLVWTSKSDAWDKLPVRLFFESPSRENLAHKIVSKINNIQPASVFITRDLGEDSYFKSVLTAHGYVVTGHSLIDIENIRFTDVPKTDWIFFSSSNAVNHFFDQHPNIALSTKYAVIGKGTEIALKQYGHKADFIGERSDIIETGIDFSNLAYGKTILFPKAVDSLRTIQKQLVENTAAIDLDVYKTKPKTDFENPTAEILVFTSPSNVEAFMQNGKINNNQKVIAIGKSTGKKLEEFNIREYKMAYLPDEPGLAEAVFSL